MPINSSREKTELVFVPTHTADGDCGNIIVLKDGIATSAKPLQRKSTLERRGVQFTVQVPTPIDKSEQK